ncbi:unnamed protein product [Adineta steineri]|uniref:Peptidase S1 domain-containing protein n=1 Tax=Adineta steineri TaxID=433720 RepID=A0A814JMK7_9BILA|nr:unnamed protein product [Adineta steineri]
MLYFVVPFIFIQFGLLYSSCIPSAEQCGCPHESPILFTSKIVGGYSAQKHSWPWIVSIRYAGAHQSLTSPGDAICAGTLIHEKYVLTAAHCAYDMMDGSLISNYFVVVGAHYINDTNPIRFKIKSVRLHKQYDDDLYSYDIALLELSHKVDLTNSNVGLICLPSTNNSLYPYEQMNSIVIGWGRLAENGPTSYELQQVQLPIISNRNEFCMKQISDEFIQFCAGFIEGQKDACQGDSGGPLMIYDTDTSTWHIAGVTSYGHGCAREGHPGVYTRVSVLIDWINTHINSSNKRLGGPLMIYDTDTSTWHIAGVTSYGHGCAREGHPGVYTRVSVLIDWINTHINSSNKRLSINVVLFLLCIFVFFL